ncbi:TIGR03620 family F420-dependent LLM class oxidoreductase [Streptomyces sp. NPDC059740]|uniref:TIGR03620 family F420-dependent LLM class oxidoreductase n=1 Tax=Streptomyces sp. NPDC059740 TaxID=3346926 RepID=UPI003649DDE1
MALNDTLGRYGLWAVGLRTDNDDQLPAITDAAGELEELGYGTLWIGGSPSTAQVGPVLSATTHVHVGTSILNIWEHAAEDVAAQHALLTEQHGPRFVLGLGVSHSEVVARRHQEDPLFTRPYAAMRRYLDALDAAPSPVPQHLRALAALGPKMLELAGERALGALPYLVTVEHTAQARAALGDGPLLAPELKVVLDTDLDRARETARGYLGHYLGLANYTRNLQRLGFEEADFEGGGSERLLDAVFALGDAETVRRKADAFLAAGADHVALQVVQAAPGEPGALEPLPLAQWRELAKALPLGDRG